jgi:hypothetical protein
MYVCMYKHTLGIEKRLSGCGGLQAHRHIRLPHAYICVCMYIHTQSFLPLCLVYMYCIPHAYVSVCMCACILFIYVSFCLRICSGFRV